jgi:hypothetical protein
VKDLERRVAGAVRRFWQTRRRQDAAASRRDQGRSAVTGGAQLDGFVDLIRELLIENGLPEDAIYRNRGKELPGFFRPTKQWDLIVARRGELVASIELKSQVGPSFGNNFNNRTEEALGSATDLWTAYREGAFRASPRPWLGYFILLEEAPGSVNPVGVLEPHFPVFPEFRSSSYVRRYELFCQKLVRERLYDGACLLLTDRVNGRRGRFREPNPEMGFANFVALLTSRVLAYTRAPR